MTIFNDGDSGTREGGCACGAVRFIVPTIPKRIGLCHCMTCRKAHAAPFNSFAVFKLTDVSWSGNLSSWQSSPDYDRRFCGNCGSRVLAIFGEEVELSLGSFDEPNQLTPQYECWVIRREHWLPAMSFPQFQNERPPSNSDV